MWARGVQSTDEWSLLPRGGREVGELYHFSPFVSIWSRVLLPRVGKLTICFRLHASVSSLVGKVLKSPKITKIGLWYFVSSANTWVTM